MFPQILGTDSSGPLSFLADWTSHSGLGGKLLAIVVALAIFGAVFFGILALASLFSGRRGEKIQAGAFAGPAILFIVLGLVYPAILTIRRTFYNGKFFDINFGSVNSRGQFVGLENYRALFTTSGLPQVFLNTALWVVLVPLLATAFGLMYATLIDRTRGEAVSKALIFLPMAISMVGATLIWKFVYKANTSSPDATQIGVLNAIWVKLGGTPVNFLAKPDGWFPLNTMALIVIMIWLQAGFAMTILSAAIKAIPVDMIEAAKLDGVGGFQLFRYITLPSIRSSVIVVLTTIAIGTLKAFDIVQATDGGSNGDSVLANEFYNRSFVTQEPGLGAAIAVVIFLLVMPIIIFNIIQLRKENAA